MNPPVWLQSVRLPNLILLLLVIVCGLSAARLTWLWLAPQSFVSTELPAASSPRLQTAPDAVASLDQLAKWALFGRAKPSAPQIDTVQSSSLGLRLEGIVSGSTPPLVMLGVGNTVKLLQVGATVSPQVTVHAIEADRVILSNQGRLEAIRFPRPLSLNEAPPPTAHAMLSSEISDRNETSSAVTPPTSRSLMQNPQSLLQYVRLTPLDRGGKQVGFVLHPVPGQAALLTRLGLADGDVLTKADGRSVTNGDLLPQLLPLLRAGRPIPVTIERNGRPMHLSINLDALR